VKLVVTKDVANVPQCPGVTCISLRNPTNIVRRLGQAGCLEAVITSEIAMNPETDSLVEKLMAAGVKVAVVPPLRGLPLLGLTSNYFFGRELLLLHIRNNMSRLPTRVFKRLLDLGGSITLLIVLAPALIGIAVFIKIFEGGDVLFVQPRVGRNGREFFCYKFRSMKPDAEDVLQKWKEQNSEWYRLYVASNYKLADDPRVTQVGRIMRRTSLDELPQLFNVLIGDMSLVGPRPLLTREVAHYGATIELYQQIRPGITGLWQITGRSHTSFDDRVTSDEWYIKNWSFWYDLIILIKTAGVLLMRRGAY